MSFLCFKLKDIMEVYKVAICYFNSDFKKNYRCTYEITKDEIVVHIEYNIHEEIRDSNGVIMLGGNTQFENRDILIIDSDKKKNYLLKTAYYIKYSSSYGTPDSKILSSFKSNIYLESSDFKQMAELPKVLKTSKIRIYNNIVNDFIGYPSLTKNSNDKEYVIALKRKTENEIIEINENNIKSLSMSDEWSSCIDQKEHNIKVDLKGYIELELIEEIKYDEVYNYVWELIIFIQLLVPKKLKIDKIYIMIDSKFYKLNIPLKEFEYKESYIEASVEEQIGDFLKKCYKNIPYRNSESEIRNIPYIILNTSRNLEDNFLMFYRFIECYYKKQGKYNFIEYAIKQNYRNNVISNIEDITSQIISLRNHYVHSGYYIKNKNLEINYKKIKQTKNRKTYYLKNPKDYFETNVDCEWIYKKTKILYDIVIDIIFSDMLGYKDYKFNKHF